MKRLLAAALFVACAVGLTSQVSADAVALPKFAYRQLSWEQYGPSTANGSNSLCGTGTKTDTTFIGHVGQTTAIADTTEAFSTRDMAFAIPGQANSATASGLIRLYLYSSSGMLSQSTDSIFAAVDTAPTQCGPWISGTFVGGVAMTAGELAGSIMLLVDSDDNSAVSTASKLYGSPWFRIRVRSDGNSAAIFQAVRAMIAYPSRTD